MSRWLLAVMALFVGCLNPMPDDFPQDRDSDGSGDVGSGPALGSAGASTGIDEPNDEGDSDPAPPNSGPSIGVEDAGAPLGDGGVTAAEATDAAPADAGCPGSGVAP